MGKILILGGTGAMGLHVVNLLENSGFDCVITSRHFHQSTKGKKYIIGDAHKMDFLERVLSMHRWEVIIDFMSYSTAEFKLRAKKFLTIAGNMCS